MAEDRFPKVGVEFVAENYDGIIDAIKNVGKDIDSLGGQMTDTVSAAATMAGGMAGVGAVLGGLAIGAADAILDKFGRLRLEMIAVAQTSMAIAGEVEMLGVALQTVADNAGISSEQVDTTVGEIEDLGITSRVTAQALTNLITSELEIADAGKLFRVAQDVATTGMRNSSQTAEMLVYAITRLDTQMLRSAGIIVDDLGSAYVEYGKTIGKTRDQLTVAERQQALYTEVLEEGAKFAGAYEESLKTVAKQLGTQERLVETLYQTIGGYLIPAQWEFVRAQNHVLESLTQSIDEGGRFETSLLAMGVAAEYTTKAIMEAGTNILDSILGTTGEVGDAVGTVDDRVEEILGSLPMRAMFWGAELINQYATGIIRGAQVVLVSAMKAINHMLIAWLMPHSPPKVAPRIDIWGGQTMTEYLRGFTKADYSVLKGVQGPLKRALDTMVSAGQLTGVGSANIFTNLSENIARDMAELGSISMSTLDTIAQATGEHGVQIAELAYLYSEYTASINAAADASARLTNAQEGVADAQKNISRIIAEYNELRRAGATDETLKAKRDELDAAKLGLTESKTELGLAEDSVEVAEEKTDFLKDQVDLQNELIKQLQTIAQMQLSAAKQAITAEMPELSGGGMGLPVSDEDEDDKLKNVSKVETLASIIEKSMEDIFAPMNDAWDDMQSELTEQWDTFAGLFSDFLETIGIDVENVDWEAVARTVGIITLALVTLGGVLTGVTIAITALVVGGIALLAAALVGLGYLLGWIYFKVVIGLLTIRGKVLERFGEIKEAISEFAGTAGETLKTFFTETIPQYFTDFIERFTGWTTSMKEKGKDLIEGLKQGLSDAIEPLMTWLQGKVDAILKLFNIVADSHSPSRRTAEAGRNWMRGLVVGMEDASSLVDRTVAKVTNNAMRTMQTATALPSGGSTINNEYNFSVDANYANQQSPATISDDLAAMIAVSRMS